VHLGELGSWADAALEAVLTARAGAGAGGRLEHGEVRAVAEDGESVDVRDDRVEGLARTSSRGVGVRVLVDGAWGFAATSVLTGRSLRATVDRAIEIARASSMVRRDELAVVLDDSPPAVGRYETPAERDPLEVPPGDKVEHLLAAAALASGIPGVAYAEATTDAWRRRTAFRSTAGGRADQSVLQVGGGIVVYAIGDGEVQRRSYPNSFRGQFVTGGWECVLRDDLPGHAEQTAREAVALLAAPDLPHRENATVLLESSQLALQVHESIGHAVELDRILGMERAYAGTSFVQVGDRDRLRYGSPLVTVTADATTPGGLGTFGFDDEGVPAGTATIVSSGMLQGFLSNRETAARIGERSNGTARADSWGTIPLIRMNNVHLQPGPDEVGLTQLVADTSDGFLFLTNRSWSIDDRRSNFQFGCEAAYEIRAGQLGRLFRNPTYAGLTTGFWRSCDALGGRSDWRVWGTPNCGKGQPGQVARVAHGAPTGRFRATVGVR
jgi:TldD protein